MKWWISTEKERERLQSELDQVKSQAERNKLGQFATPFTLARQIMRVAQAYQTLIPEQVRFFEPALGTGAFYSAYLAEAGGAPPGRAVGVEIDESVASTAQTLWGATGLSVHVQDFLALSPPTTEEEKFNLLVTNPPYVRHHHLSARDKKKLIQLVKETLDFRPSGLMGLYGYFLLLAHRWLQNEAIAAWLIPVEFMDVGYGIALKKYLSGKVELLRVHRFDADDAQFEGVYVTSAVLFFRNIQPSANHEVIFTTGPSITKPRSSEHVSLSELKGLRKWTAIGAHSSLPSSRGLSEDRDLVTIGDFFDVKRGIATGANKFFIMSISQAEQRKIPSRFLKPILPSPRYLANTKVIDGDANGLPAVQPQLVLFDCDLSPEKLVDEYQEVYEYVLAGKRKHLHRRYLLSRRSPWYRQEQRAVAPLLCSYMGRKKDDGSSIRFYRNKSQAVATNVYLLLYPKPWVLRDLQEPEVFFDAIFRRLRTLDQQEVVHHGRTYGGGLDKIEPNELQRVVLGTFEELEESIPLLSEWKAFVQETAFTQHQLPFAS